VLTLPWMWKGNVVGGEGEAARDRAGDVSSISCFRQLGRQVSHILEPVRGGSGAEPFGPPRVREHERTGALFGLGDVQEGLGEHVKGPRGLMVAPLRGRERIVDGNVHLDDIDCGLNRPRAVLGWQVGRARAPRRRVLGDRRPPRRIGHIESLVLESAFERGHLGLQDRVVRRAESGKLDQATTYRPVPDPGPSGHSSTRLRRTQLLHGTASAHPPTPRTLPVALELEAAAL
jgi:hypothetical protein